MILGFVSGPSTTTAGLSLASLPPPTSAEVAGARNAILKSLYEDRGPLIDAKLAGVITTDDLARLVDIDREIERWEAEELRATEPVQDTVWQKLDALANRTLALRAKIEARRSSR